MRYREHLMRMDAARQELKVLFARLSPDQLIGVSRTYLEACVTHDLIKTLPIPTPNYKNDAEALHAQFRELITYAKETLAMTQDYVAQAFAKVQATLPDNASYWKEAESHRGFNLDQMRNGMKKGEFALLSTFSPFSKSNIGNQLFDIPQGESKVEPGLNSDALLKGGFSLLNQPALLQSFSRNSGVIKSTLGHDMAVEWYRKNPDSMPEEEFLARMTGRAFDLEDGTVVIVDSMEADCQWTAEQIESMLPPILKDIVETPTYRPMNATTHKLHEFVLRLNNFREAVDFENNLRLAKRERYMAHDDLKLMLGKEFPRLQLELGEVLFTNNQVNWEAVKYLEGAGYQLSYFKQGHATFSNQIHLYLTRGYITVTPVTVQ